MSDITCRWMQKALDDLRLAEVALEIGVDPGLAAFHSQQAVEKALKALLTAFQVRPPKVHDIWELVDLLSDKVDTEYIKRLHVEDLTYYAVEARYPGPPVVEEEAREALMIAREAVEWVRERLREKGVEC